MAKTRIILLQIIFFPVSLSMTGPQLGVWCFWCLSEEPTLPAPLGEASGHLWVCVGAVSVGTGAGPYWVLSLPPSAASLGLSGAD